jgi:hypothetical protein
MTPAKADLTYKTYAGTGAYPTFPGNGGSLYYGTVLSTGTVTSLDYNWGSGLVLDSGRNERVIVNFYGYHYQCQDTGSQSDMTVLSVQADDGVYMKIGQTQSSSMIGMNRVLACGITFQQTKHSQVDKLIILICGGMKTVEVPPLSYIGTKQVQWPWCPARHIQPRYPRPHTHQHPHQHSYSRGRTLGTSPPTATPYT